MRKNFRGILLLIILSVPISSAFAYPPCGAFAQPTEEWFCRTETIPYQLVRVRADIPFAWIRAEASSHAAIVDTVLPGNTASMITLADETGVASTVWDGYQWWWEVELYPDGGSRGWVEMASLLNYVEAYPSPGQIRDASIEILADWTLPLSGEIETGMSFAWVRETPSSGGRIVYTLLAGQEFELTGGNRFDGYQWWWAIRISQSSGDVTGWLEQGSITPLVD